MAGAAADEANEEGGRSRSIVHRSVLWFLGWSLCAMAVLAVGTVVVATELANDAALREATIRGAALGRTVAGPLVDHRVRTGGPTERSTLDAVLRNRLDDQTIVHIKLWSRDGTVIWADEKNLVGRTFGLPPEVRKLFGTDAVSANFSDLSEDENSAERADAPLLEVYSGTRDADGVPLVFESYWSTGHIQSDTRAIRRRLVPLALGALALFELAVLPLALTLARRVDRVQAERSRVLRHALSAADRERQRIAQDLHDGLLQDLAGLGYALPSVRDQLPPDLEAPRATISESVSIIERDIAALRLLLTDVYPADLATEGLEQAVAELVVRVEATGVDVDVDVAALHAGTSTEVCQLAYRVIREGLRNVTKHAAASQAQVSARLEGSDAVVSVIDNGTGMASTDPAEPGHLGLRLLNDSLRDVGGTLVLERTAGGGTSLTATFPSSIAAALG